MRIVREQLKEACGGGGAGWRGRRRKVGVGKGCDEMEGGKEGRKERDGRMEVERREEWRE